MRIVGGNSGGIRINFPKNLNLRPTTDKCKEALFNILNNEFDFKSIKILDLFSGTGGISYEFASRGTKKIISSIIEDILLSLAVLKTLDEGTVPIGVKFSSTI